MNYSEPLSQQIVVFVRAIGSGVFIGIVYDFIFAVRSIVSQNKTAIIVQDILFGIAASIISFFFAVLFGAGIVRFNLIVAQAAGALAFHFSVGKTVSSVITCAGTAVKKTVKAVLHPFVYAAGRLKLFAVEISDTAAEKLSKVKRKVFFKEKKALLKKNDEKTDKKI